MEYRNNKTYKLNNYLNRIDKQIYNRINIEENIKKLEKLLGQPYKIMQIKMILFRAYLEDGRIEEALNLKKNIYDITKDPQELFDIVKLYLNIGDLELAKKYIDDCPFSNEKISAEAFYYKRIGEYDKAIELYGNLRHTGLENEMYIELSNVYLLMGDVKSASRCYQKLLNTNLKYEALVRLIGIALTENDSNVENLFNRFNIETHAHRGDLVHIKRCLSYYKYIKGELTKNNIEGYLEKQLFNYSKEEAIKHIIARHQRKGNLYRFNQEINLYDVYDYCKEHLDILVLHDKSDKYLVKMPYDIGYLMNYKTDLLEVVTIGNTDKILTIYPIARKGVYNYDKLMERNLGGAKIYEKK